MLKLLNAISQTNSPGEKIQLLRGYPFQGVLKSTLKSALDPFITYGITDFDDIKEGGGDLIVAEVLAQLSRRELTGGEAKQVLGAALAGYPEEDKEVVRRILRKDLRCGLGSKLANTAYPGLVPEFEVMRAKKFEKLKPKVQYVIEPKYDGLRCLAFVRHGGVKLFSRNGLEFTSSDHLKPEILNLVRDRDCVLDGELTSGNFNASMSAVRRKQQPNDHTVFTAFDILTGDQWEAPTQVYRYRRSNLESLDWEGRQKLQLAPCYPVEDEDEVLRYYGHFLDLGYEGGMVKALNGLYRFKRHSDWQKLKEQNDVDLVCEGVVQGEGKYAQTLGALRFTFKGKRISIGTGFSDEERDLWWKNPSLIKGKVCELHYHQVTPDGALRHGRFFCIREDKTPR